MKTVFYIIKPKRGQASIGTVTVETSLLDPVVVRSLVESIENAINAACDNNRAHLNGEYCAVEQPEIDEGEEAYKEHTDIRP